MCNQQVFNFVSSKSEYTEMVTYICMFSKIPQDVHEKEKGKKSIYKSIVLPPDTEQM